jgi:hypothetical protein
MSARMQGSFLADSKWCIMLCKLAALEEHLGGQGSGVNKAEGLTVVGFYSR